MTGQHPLVVQEFLAPRTEMNRSRGDVKWGYFQMKRLIAVLAPVALAGCFAREPQWTVVSADPAHDMITAHTICKGEVARASIGAPSLEATDQGNAVSNLGQTMQNVAVRGRQQQAVIEGCMAREGYALR